MNELYERAVRWLTRDEDWRYGVLAVIALRELWDNYYGGEGAPTPDWPNVMGLMGQAGRKARSDLATNPNRTRKGTSLAGMPAADESQRRYEGADAEYAIREADLRWWTLQEALNALEKTLWRVPDEQIEEAVETLYPLMKKLIDKGIVGWNDGEARHVTMARTFVERGREKVLREIGSVAGTKAKRMKPPTSVPTSGRASVPVVLADPGTGRSWVVYPNRYERIIPEGAQALLGEANRPPVRVGTEQRELSDDRLADLKRPVTTPGRNSGKQKGRVGGPMITRSRP